MQGVLSRRARRDGAHAQRPYPSTPVTEWILALPAIEAGGALNSLVPSITVGGSATARWLRSPYEPCTARRSDLGLLLHGPPSTLIGRRGDVGWRRTSNPKVASSIGSTGALRKPLIKSVAPAVGYPSGQRGLTVNQLRYRFRGSNPLPTTSSRTATVIEATPSRLSVQAPVAQW